MATLSDLTKQIDWLALSAAALSTVTARFITGCYLATRPLNDSAHVPERSQRGLVPMLVGHAVEAFLGGEVYGEANLRWFAEARDRRKKLIQVRSFNHPSLTPIDPRDVEYMLLENGSNYLKAPHYRAVALILGAHGLVTIMDEDVHTVQRRLVSAAFSPAVLRDIADGTMRHSIGTAMDHFAQRKEAALPVEEALDDMTLDIIATAAFRQPNIQGANIAAEFKSMSVNLAKALYVFLPMGHLIRTSAVRTVLACRDKIRNASLKFVAQLRAQQPSDAVAETSSKALLPSASRKMLVDHMADAVQLTDGEIADHSLTFLFAGHETTSTALAWGCYALAANPRIQKLLHEELSEAIGLRQVPDQDTLKSLKLLDFTAKEILRLYGPIGGLGRIAKSDDLLPSGAFIPAGTGVEFFMLAHHRDPTIWGPTADEFDPLRWDDAALLERVGQGGYFPFFLGKRNCIGKDLAFTELRMTLAALVRRFEIVWPEGEATPVRKLFITLRSEQPIRVIFRERTA